MNSIDTQWICTAWRLGIGLYGIDPLHINNTLSEFWKNLKPTLDIYSTITSMQKISDKQSIWYSATWTSNGEQTIASFPFGYKEWMERWISNSGFSVKVNNYYYEIIWRVSMNYSTITASSATKLHDKVHILSSNLSDLHNIYRFYDTLQKIPYEIVRLDDKVRRVIV
jgi:alanine racemase